MKAAYGWPGGSCAGDGQLTIADNGDSNDNLTGTVRKLANGDFAKLNLVLRAGDESDWNSWKRFKHDATLAVTYYEKPGVPTATGVRSTSAAGGLCPTSATNAVTVGEKRPDFTATAQSAINRPGYGRRRVQFVVERLSGTSWVAQVTQTMNTKTWSGDNTVIGYKPTYDLPDNAAYRLRTRTLAHNEDSTSGLWSGYSANCYFKIDSTGPKAPIVTALTVYSICGVDCVEAGEPGVTGTFKFQPGPGDTNVTGYQWQIVGKTGWNNVTGSPVTASVKPATAGTLQLAVQAKDAAGRYGATTAVRFRVKAPPDAEVGTWRVEDPADSTELADTSTVGTTRRPVTLGAGASTDDRGRRTSDLVPNDRSIRLTGAAGSEAATSGPVIDTAKSFTVGMWAYLEHRNGTQVLLSQHQAATGASHPGLNIYWGAGSGWACNFHKRDAAGVTQSFVSASALTTSPIKVWTHVVCSYDAATKSIQVIVNGVPYSANVQSGAEPLPEATNGPMVLGRNRDHLGNPGGYFNGLIDEVRVWRRTLTPTELKEVANEVQKSSASPDEEGGYEGEGVQATTLVGSWIAASSDGMSDESSYQRGALSLVGGASVTEAGLSLDGVDDSARLSGPVLDDNASFTISALATVDAAAISAAPKSSFSVIAAQKSATSPLGMSWLLAFFKTGAVGSTEGVWHVWRDSGGLIPAHVKSELPTAVGDVEVRVTEVFDAVAGKVRLHMGLQEQPGDMYATASALTKPDGEMSIGSRPGLASPNTWTEFMPGTVNELRIWAGAMNQDQMLNAGLF